MWTMVHMRNADLEVDRRHIQLGSYLISGQLFLLMIQFRYCLGASGPSRRRSTGQALEELMLSLVLFTTSRLSCWTAS